MATRYTEEQHEWLLLNFPRMTNRELAEAFEGRFGTPTTYEAMRSYGNNHRLRKDPEVARRALRAAHGGTTEEEDAFLREFVPGRGTREISEAFEARFGRELTRGQLGAAKARLGVRSGVNAGRFEKGHTNWNKGKTWDEMGISEEARERMRAGHFRKGEPNEYNAGRMRELLDTKVGPDGVLMVYVGTRNVRHPTYRWISYARLVWMQHNGRDWPEGHRVVFADHDNRNFSPENVVAVPDDIACMIQGNPRGKAMPYHDRETLEVAMTHARLIRARVAAERRLREATPRAR